MLSMVKTWAEDETVCARKDPRDALRMLANVYGRPPIRKSFPRERVFVQCDLSGVPAARRELKLDGTIILAVGSQETDQHTVRDLKLRKGAGIVAGDHRLEIRQATRMTYDTVLEAKQIWLDMPELLRWHLMRVDAMVDNEAVRTLYDLPFEMGAAAPGMAITLCRDTDVATMTFTTFRRLDEWKMRFCYTFGTGPGEARKIEEAAK